MKATPVRPQLCVTPAGDNEETRCDASTDAAVAAQPRHGASMEGRRPRSKSATAPKVVLEDANLILPGLYLGSYKAAEDASKLKEQGVTHVLIAAANIQPLYPTEFSYLVLHEVLDTEEQDIMSHFGDTTSFIHEARNQGGAVLVVCMVGMSRSASVVIAFVMDELNMCAEDAYCLVKRARSKVCPNPSFAQQLRLFHIMRDTFLRQDGEAKELLASDVHDEEVRAKTAEDTRTTRCDDEDQRKRAEQDYAMVRHISHMYHSAHKLSREGRIPAECFAKDPQTLSPDVLPERTYGCGQCNRVLFTQLNVLPHKKKRPTIACNVVFIQPLDWMIAQHKNVKDEEIPIVGDDEEQGEKRNEQKKEEARVRYLSSFHSQRTGEALQFITKERLGNLQKVFGELRCPDCNHKVGYWNWMGNGCYCGQRMMPAFCIERKFVSDASAPRAEASPSSSTTPEDQHTPSAANPPTETQLTACTEHINDAPSG